MNIYIKFETILANLRTRSISYTEPNFIKNLILEIAAIRCIRRSLIWVHQGHYYDKRFECRVTGLSAPVSLSTFGPILIYCCMRVFSSKANADGDTFLVCLQEGSCCNRG